MGVLYSVLSLLIILSGILVAKGSLRPNIVMIVADDMGWDDVSFHGSNQVLTPNIDLLAYTGIAIERHYSHCVCTPSRAALLTGKFAHTIGMQGYPLTNGEDRGLPLTEKILPEYLKELGYATHLVGKWHLGHSHDEYLPTSRGFDSHFGFRGGYIDYYEYLNEETWSHGQVAGLDLYRNRTAAWDVKGYLTDVFTEETKSIIQSHDKSKPLFLMVAHSAPHSGNDGALLQAPPDVVRNMRYVESPERRIYTAMMKKLDDSVGEIVSALSEKKILDNTVIVFISDNGGMPVGNSVNYASNWPLRGSKFTPFEGGIRTGALIWTFALPPPHVWRGNMHIVDWLPTLLKAADNNKSISNIDGKDHWNIIISNLPSDRKEFYEIYTYGEQSFSSVVADGFKLIVGNVTKDYSKHFSGDLRGIIGAPPSYTESIKMSKVYSVLKKMGQPFKMEDANLRNDIQVNCPSSSSEDLLCYVARATYLFDLKNDPCENLDLSTILPRTAEKLMTKLQTEMKRVKERPYPVFRDPRALPSLHNYTWSTWH